MGIEWDVADLVESCDGLDLAGFIDLNPNASTREVPHLGDDSSWDTIRTSMPGLRVVLALDDPVRREILFAHYGEPAISTLISPLAHISARSFVGVGTIVQHYAVIMPYAQIGRACKINVGAVVHHEAVIHDFVTLAPGVQVLGNVMIGKGAYLGAGSVVRQRSRIGEGAVVGAGAVVVHDVPPGATVVGVPASRRLK